MNNDRIEGNWKELKGQIKEQYGKLTDQEITEAEGNAQKLAGNLQAKYGYAKDEAQKKANKFFE
jgi:uncharacterized protein YjbJ (UPF0337 family)